MLSFAESSGSGAWVTAAEAGAAERAKAANQKEQIVTRRKANVTFLLLLPGEQTRPVNAMEELKTLKRDRGIYFRPLLDAFLAP